jgi:F0F1-type ATP synthase assembly protein I
MMCEKASFMTELKTSFFFETMFKTILTIVWLISFSMILKKSMFFEYVVFFVFSMSSRLTATHEKKKKFIKH